ncbi:MAG TPA: ribonuclease H-like domain-containing protein [Candidatus Nanopelagicaceae bacterium]|nr:ribonuclease H-like domain-containing protein [Candidatus Nanopelagicaceae bacterium]
MTSELRLRLGALQGDPRLGLSPRVPVSQRSADPVLDEESRAAGFQELGFDWDGQRGLLVRGLDMAIADLGISEDLLAADRLQNLSEVVPKVPATITCFDLETTGLQRGTGTVPFLYGWAVITGDRVHFEQWLLTQLGQETPLVEAAISQLRATDLLVTYNGASYDLPLLRTRMVMAGVDRAWPATPHLDLLPMVRRLFRHRLDRCSLRRVEESVLGQSRDHDLPGREAPERYWQFLRTGDPRPLAAVLEHNQQDVLSLARLLERLVRHVDLEGPHPSDWLSLGRFIEERGDLSGAEGVYRKAEACSPPPLDRAAALRRARLLRRQGLDDQARQAWSSIWERWHDPEAAEAICVDLEHHQNDLDGALELAREGLRSAPVGWDQRFARRIWRLQSKLGRTATVGTGAGPRTGARPWSGWLPGGESYEAWIALRRGGPSSLAVDERRFGRAEAVGR